MNHFLYFVKSEMRRRKISPVDFFKDLVGWNCFYVTPFVCIDSIFQYPGCDLNVVAIEGKTDKGSDFLYPWEIRQQNRGAVQAG